MALLTRNNLRRMPLIRQRQVVTAKWILGQDAFTEQSYLLHVDYPTFLAKIGDSEHEGGLASFSYAARDGRWFYDFVWFDPYPGDSHFLSLMREAEEALRTRLFQ